MSGSLCPPICFIAVVYCLESIVFGYQISVLRMVGKVGVGAQFCSLKDQGAGCCLMIFDLGFPYYKKEAASFRYNGAINIY